MEFISWVWMLDVRMQSNHNISLLSIVNICKNTLPFNGGGGRSTFVFGRAL
jgi:hypothetical protein